MLYYAFALEFSDMIEKAEENVGKGRSGNNRQSGVTVVDDEAEQSSGKSGCCG